MRKLLLAAAAIVMAACSTPKAEADYASFVNPKIGTGGHGHVFVIGFSHTHLSGTGIGDLFDITVMPTTGPTTPGRGIHGKPDEGAWSYADRSKEVCQPGYYSVPLERYNITAELTATSRVGLHRYTFPASEDARLVFDLENGGCWDDVTDAGFEVVRNADGQVTALGGYRYSTGWAKNQKIFFWAEFSRPGVSFTETENPRNESERGRTRKPLYGYLGLGSTAEGDQVLLKVALSPVSVEGAKANMAAELPGWDFDTVKADARSAWNKELGKVRIETDSEDQRAVFYTALYHTMIAPSAFNDVDGQYRGSDDVVRKGDFQNYTTFSLWDTYRAAMPLMTLLHPERMDDMVATMYHIYKEQGDLPVWHLMGNETDCMVGNPGLISFADAVVKGFRAGLTDDQIIDAMVVSATTPDRGQNFRMQYGYIPANLYHESVANDMEYAIADGALANCAAFLGRPDIAATYRERSHSYRHFWDPELQFMRGRKTDGSFTEPFDPIYSRHEQSDYTEGTGWQYLWLVPQDVDGLVELFGSKEATLEKLDGLFEAPDHVVGENASPDISGLIGQYAHGNEPGHHTIYLYSMLGRPDKAATRLHQVYEEMYFNDVEGLAGNEDVGQMSAWYVLSSMGFYQVEPACPRYWFGLPLFRKQVVKVSGGEFTITANGPLDGHITAVKLNGQAYDKPYIEHAQIITGGTLEYEMSK